MALAHIEDDYREQPWSAEQLENLDGSEAHNLLPHNILPVIGREADVWHVDDRLVCEATDLLALQSPAAAAVIDVSRVHPMRQLFEMCGCNAQVFLSKLDSKPRLRRAAVNWLKGSKQEAECIGLSL